MESSGILRLIENTAYWQDGRAGFQTLNVSNPAAGPLSFARPMVQNLFCLSVNEK